MYNQIRSKRYNQSHQFMDIPHRTTSEPSFGLKSQDFNTGARLGHLRDVDFYTVHSDIPIIGQCSVMPMSPPPRSIDLQIEYYSGFEHPTRNDDHEEAIEIMGGVCLASNMNGLIKPKREIEREFTISKLCSDRGFQCASRRGRH